jgi:hypothetical protein
MTGVRHLVAAALLVTSCTGGGPSPAPPPTATSPAAAPTLAAGQRPPSDRVLPASLGACHGEPPAPEDPFEVLPRRGLWLTVEGLAEPRPRLPGAAPVASVTGMFLVRTPPGRQQYADVVRRLFMPEPTAAAVAEALRLGAEVVVRTGQDGDLRHVAYAVAFLGGEAAFVGECAYDALTVPVAARLGQPEPYLRAMFGQSPEEIRRILAAPPPVAGTPSPRAVPKAAARSAEARRAFLLVRPARGTKGFAWVCAVDPARRLGCAGVGSGGPPRKEVRYDPADPRLRLRLYRAGAPAARAELVEVDLRRLAAAAGVDLRATTPLLYVELAASPTFDEVVADPRRGRELVAAVRVAPCTVRRCVP